VTGSGTTWTVSANTGLGAGTLGLNQTGPGSVSPTLSGTFTGQVYTISAPPLLAEYRMDEALWNGTANDVADISGNGNNARAFNGASTVGTSPAITGNPGTCNYGVFDNGGTITQGYVQTPLPDLTTDFTVTAWIRTINNTVSGQRILIDDQNNSGGYGISLGDGTAGILRFFSRGITPVILDSTYTIANNTWYFVAAVADITNKKRTIYVFSAAGALLNTTTEGAWTGGAWGTDAGPVSIGGEVNGPPQTELPASFHFHGNLDEVRVYQQALSPAAVTAIATQTHACAIVVAVPNHYELSMPTSSIACQPTPVTVTACTDATSPCTNKFAGASGTTATLATTGGTLGSTTVTFDATGVASTTLSYPLAPDGTVVTVTLSGEQIAASNLRQWCPNGTACVVANIGTTTFNTAGFIFSTAAGGGVATIPTQVAGITSATNYLRAVKSSTTTQACEAALSGSQSVNFAYECNDPTSCYTSNLMSVNGGPPSGATTIARNNNGSVGSYTSVSMSFDINGNAPFTFNYSDAGQVKLWASKSAGGLLLSALAGSSNSFVVKPFDFGVVPCDASVVGNCITPPADPGLLGSGSVFAKAGKLFKATVIARTAAGAATPSFGLGSNNGTETVSLTHTRVAPTSAGAVNGTLSTTPIQRSSFSNGIATVSDLSWSEVGVITLTATNNAFLGNTLTTTGTTGNVGRFIPDHFDTVVTPQGGGFAYSGNPAVPGPLVPGQPFTVTVTAMNGLSTPTPTANYYYINPGDFAKAVNLSLPVGTGQLYVDAVAGGIGAVPAGNFALGVGTVDRSVSTGKISFVFSSLPYAEQAIQVHAEDVDTGTSSGANGSIKIRHGRLRLFNAFGSEKADLSMPLQAEYWTGSSWVLNSDDSFTSIPAGSIALSVVPLSGTLSAVIPRPGPFTLSGGQGSVVLASPMASGSVDLAINLGTSAADQSCLTVHPGTTGAAIPWLRSINGNCATTYDRDPSARGTFGVYAPETKRTIHVRELF
jgi:MSHA biogenesis protein MshQ